MSQEIISEDQHLLSTDNGDPVEMPTEWFVGIGSRQSGPLSEKVIKDLIFRKVIKPMDLVWRDGMDDWARLQDVSELQNQVGQMKDASDNLPRPDGDHEPVESDFQPGEVNPSSDLIEATPIRNTQIIENSNRENSSQRIASFDSPVDRFNDGSRIDSAPRHEPNRVDVQLWQEFNSLVPTERTVAVEKKRPVKFALVAGSCLLAIAAAASFFILSYGHPGQDLSAITSIIDRVSRIGHRVLQKEQNVGRVAVRPENAASTSAVPKRETSTKKEGRESAGPVVAPTKTDSPEVNTDNIAVKKRSKPSRVKRSQDKPAPVRSRATSQDKSNISTDKPLKRTTSNRDEAQAPPVTEDELPSTDKPLKRTTSNRDEAQTPPVTEDEPPVPTPPELEAKKPQQPSRAEIFAALREVTPDVRACSRGNKGVGTAAISVEGQSGKVTKVTITGVDSSVHECMQKAISHARFPSFKKESIDIRVPFRL